MLPDSYVDPEYKDYGGTFLLLHCRYSFLWRHCMIAYVLGWYYGIGGCSLVDWFLQIDKYYISSWKHDEACIFFVFQWLWGTD